MYNIEISMDNMVHIFLKMYKRMAVLWSRIILKDVVNSLLLASETRGHLIPKYYTQENTVSSLWPTQQFSVVPDRLTSHGLSRDHQ